MFIPPTWGRKTMPRTFLVLLDEQLAASETSVSCPATRVEKIGEAELADEYEEGKKRALDEAIAYALSES
jgi:hypothetical protein